MNTTDGAGAGAGARELLTMALEAAVPLYIAQLQRLTIDEIVAIAREAGPLLAEKGDRLLFRGAKRGETAAVFNATARGIAALAFAPGGVTVFGRHWEARCDSAPGDASL